MKIISSIDGLTEKGYNVTIKIETLIEDISSLKKDIWVLLGKKVRTEPQEQDQEKKSKKKPVG